MISFSATTVSDPGNVVIYESSASDLGSKTARVTRTATLDGGVYINHSGVTDGDRTLRIKGRITETQALALTALYENHTSVLVSMHDGIYTGAISALSTQNGNLIMTYLIEQKES
jgi:hypothetical protein